MPNDPELPLPESPEHMHDDGDELLPETYERRLHRSVFAFLRKAVGPQAEDEDIEKLVDLAVPIKNGLPAPVSWEAATPARIRELKKAASVLRPFRVAGSVVEVHEPQVLRLPDAPGEFRRVETTSIRLIDRDGDSVWSLDLLGVDIQLIHDLRRMASSIEFLCVPIDLPLKLDPKTPQRSVAVGPRGFFVSIAGARPTNSMLDLLGATAEERSKTEVLLKKLQGEGVAPARYLFEQVVQQLNIVGLDEFAELQDLIHFAVLQALSCGRVDHAPGRLHGLVVGPPGQGKKLVGLVAHALNVTCVELSATKFSAAGLVGASRPTEGGWVSQPGLLPQAAHGVAILQDGHGWEGAAFRKLAPMLQELMEDGTVRDSVAGGLRRDAPTSLLIDLNRSAQVTRGPVGSGHEASLLQNRPVISRIDGIVEIPENVHRSWSISRRLYATMRGGAGDLDHQPWVRELRLLVALLRDRNPDVSLTQVREVMAAVHDDIYTKNAADFATMPEASDIPARMAISFARFVAASARGRDSDEAQPSDIDVATTFINRKLEFLKIRGTSYPSSATGTSSPQQRAAWFAGLAGREVHTADVVNAYKEQTGEVICERTARRHLQQAGGVRTGKGQYLIPSASMQPSSEAVAPQGHEPLGAAGQLLGGNQPG